MKKLWAKHLQWLMSSRPLGCSAGSARRSNLLFRAWETVTLPEWAGGFLSGGSAEKRGGDLLTLLSAVKRGDLCI